jgi:BNR repeat-like domain
MNYAIVRLYCTSALLMFVLPGLTSAELITAPVAITHDGQCSGNVAMLKRKNGDLVTVFNSGTDPRGLFSSVSTDKGKTWSKQAYINSGWDRAALLENQDRQLVLVANEGGAYSISISDNGTSWRLVGNVTILRSNYIIGDLMQAKNGSYYLTYSSYEEPQPIRSYVYVSRSLDLKTWSEPVKISKHGYSEMSSSLVQNKDKSFALAYNSYPEKGIMLATSKDGKKWTTPKKIVTFSTELPVRLRLQNIGSKSVLIYGNDAFTQMSTRQGSRWGNSRILYSPTVFESAVVDMGLGKLGIAFFNSGEGPRNLSFDTIAQP